MDRFFQGSNFFADVNPYEIPFTSAAPRSIFLSDLDGDGKPDLVVGTAVGAANRYYINPGNGRFDQSITTSDFGGNEATRSVIVADMNGDSVPDILVGNEGQT